VYRLGKEPEIQEKLRNEILNAFGKNTPTYDELGKLEYLNYFLKENLRMVSFFLC
jgi:cytochrome P450